MKTLCVNLNKSTTVYMDFKNHTMSNVESAVKRDKTILTKDDIINNVKQLFEDHLNKQNDKLMEEKHEHMSTKRSLAEVKAALDIQTSEKMNLEIKVKNQEEIMKVQEEPIIYQEGKMNEQKRFIDEKNVKLNELQ